jgi:hypothetical protein
VVNTSPMYGLVQFPTTQPIPALLNCGWCGIRLAAVPDDPREFEGFYYHPGCISAARTKAFYGVPAGPWK